MPRLVVMAAISTLVESLPATKLDDNWSVPLTAAALCQMLGLHPRTVAPLI
jgi:dolichol kinase